MAQFQPNRADINTHDPRLKEATSILATNFSQPGLTLKQLGRAVGLSRQRLGNLFMVHTGAPFRYLLRLKRTDRAFFLLRNTSLLIKQIAIDTGYSTTAQFDRDFKAVYGLSPRGFRALGSEEQDLRSRLAKLNPTVPENDGSKVFLGLTIGLPLQ